MTFVKHELGYYGIKDNTLDSISFPSEGYADCYEIENVSQWFQARNKTLAWLLNKYDFKGDFIDIGGGNGFQLHFFQQHLFNTKNMKSAMCEPGVDGCANAALRNVQNVYHCIDQQFPWDQFDTGAIGFFDVIEHIDKDVEFLNGIQKKVKVGTRFYITVPALKTLWSTEDVRAGHFRRFNSSELNRVSKGTGMKLVYRSYFFSYYVPLVWLLRVLPEIFGKGPTQEQISENEKKYHKGTGGLLNKVLHAIHSIELFCMKLGIRMKTGTSLVAVLEKVKD